MFDFKPFQKMYVNSFKKIEKKLGNIGCLRYICNRKKG